MSDIATMIAAVTPMLVAGGGAVAFFLGRFDKRVAAAEAKVADCEKHRDADKETIRRLTFEVRRDGRAVRMLAQELHAIDPINVTLRNVASLLRLKYDPSLAMPDDFTDLLAKIERAAA